MGNGRSATTASATAASIASMVGGAVASVPVVMASTAAEPRRGVEPGGLRSLGSTTPPAPSPPASTLSTSPPSAAPAASAARSPILIWFLLVVLSIGIFAHFLIFVLIVKHRKSPSVKAAQPVGQSLIAFAGAAAFAGGICLVVPPSEASCALSEPLIFLFVTVIGASLAGMVWRVERIVAPILLMGRGRIRLSCEDDPFFAKVKRMHRIFLTSLSWGPFRKRKRTTIRQKVSNGSLVRLIGCLALPQIVLQLLRLCLPFLRSHPSPNVHDMCTNPGGAWVTALGTILTMIPFASALMTTTKADGDASIPAVLCEAKAIRNAIFYFALFSISTVPILAFEAADANHSVVTYISIYLLIAAVAPVTLFVVLPKLLPIIFHSKELGGIAEQIRSSARRMSFEDDLDRRYERAIDALEQGRVFEEMEMPNSTIKLYNEALEMWQSKKAELNRHFAGDYTTSEIQDILLQNDAKLIASILTAKAEFHEKAEKNTFFMAAKCYLKAIEIFEFAPACASMRERSTVYPCFHSMFRLLRQGRFERDFVFERALAVRFVQETEKSQDVHRAVALALSAQMKARAGKIGEALEEVDKMNEKYSAEDCAAIRDASGIDVCLLTNSMSAIWYMELRDETNAIKRCGRTIQMLDDRDRASTDPEEMHLVLTPVIAVLKNKRPTLLKNLYVTHVANHVRGPMAFYMRNMQLMLTFNSGERMQGDLSFVLSKDNVQHTRAADYVNITLGLSANTVAAQACIFLARQDMMAGDCRDILCTGWSQTLLVDKGLAFATVANQNQAENGHMISAIANAKNESVLKALLDLAKKIGHDPQGGLAMKRASSNVSVAKMRQNRFQLKAKKTLPHHLLLTHDTAAFVGLTHDSLARVFGKALSEEPRRSWKGIYIFYVSDKVNHNNFTSWEGGNAIAEDGEAKFQWPKPFAKKRSRKKS